jgi:type I restriction enzyme M protein
MKLHSETDTVIKRILPYLRRRGYDIEKDIDFETSTKHPERYTKGYVDLLVTCGQAKPIFLIEAKRTNKTLNAKDTKQAIDYGTAQKVQFVVVTNGHDIRCFNAKSGAPLKWDGRLIEKIPTRDQLKHVVQALKTNSAATDIPLGTDRSLPYRPGLPVKQLNALFSRCHNAIRKIEKNEEHAFDDFSKLLFLKLLEEKADTAPSFKLPYACLSKSAGPG